MHGPGELAPIVRVIRVLVLYRTSRSDRLGEVRPVFPLNSQQLQIGATILWALCIQPSHSQQSVSIPSPVFLQHPGAGQVAAENLKTTSADAELSCQSGDRPVTSPHDREEIKIECGQEDAGKTIGRDCVAKLVKTADRRNEHSCEL